MEKFSKESYTDSIEKLERVYLSKIHQLRRVYTQQNKKYNIGDFLFNVTGIIKVERVGYEIFMDEIYIVYYGYRYKEQQSKLSRTLDNKISSLREDLIRGKKKV